MIAAIETFPYELAFRRPYVTSRGTLTSRKLLLVLVRSDTGEAGHGEAAPLMLRGGPSLERIEADVRRAGEALVGAPEPIDPRAVGALLARCGGGVSRQALAGLDIALHDLAARRAGVPLCELLGASKPAPVPVNATLPGGDPDEVAALAAAQAEAGFTTFKLKVGLPDDARQLRAVRETVGPEARIRVDANEAWGVEEAIEFLTLHAETGLELAEQPVARLEGLAEVRRRTSVPIAADESVVDAGDASRAVAIDACDMATVKLAKVGGIAASLAIASELPVYLSSALDGPVGIAAALHVAQAIADFTEIAHGLATLGMFSDAPGPALEARSGFIEVPPGPGLGIALDPAAL